MNARYAITVAIVVSVVGVASPATATINYPDMLGVGPTEVDFLNIAESSITDPEPLYGQPIRQGNELLFFPPTFASSSANGTADTTSGMLQVTIRAAEGYFLEKIHFVEYGDYTLAGVGGAGTSAKINGTLFITDVDPGTNGTIFDMLTVAPPAPYTLPGDNFGIFTAQTEVDLTGFGIKAVQISFNNNLQTTSEQGTTSFIQKKVVNGPAVGIIVIPEPSSVVLLATGCLALIRRRRRG